MSIYFVHITEECKKEAQKYSLLDSVENLAKKIEKTQVIDNLQRRSEGYIKKLGNNFRLAIGKVYKNNEVSTDDCLLIFWRIYSRSDDDYDNNFWEDFPRACNKLNIDKIWQTKYESLDQSKLPQKLSERERQYLHTNASVTEKDANTWTILESKDWVELIKEDKSRYNLKDIHDTVLSIVDPEVTASEIQASYVKLQDEKTLFLIAPIRDKDDEKINEKYKHLEEAKSLQELMRHSHRSYPGTVLYDKELWVERIEQGDEKANLALSAEEANLLQKCRQGNHYPLFINGRPGSGKSTILQYLFADHLYRYHEFKDLNAPPLYLTYSQELLETAQNNVRTILKCNAHKVEKKPLDDEDIEDLLSKSFSTLKAYSLALLPNKEEFSPDTYTQFPEFRRWYDKNFGQNPKFKDISAELAWHVIRTYIKGMPAEESEYLTPEDFSDLPRNQKTVTEKTFKQVWKHIWSKYQKEKKWDDQDLVRKLIHLHDEGEINLPDHLVIFCDEAQDFTLNELRLIYRLSLFSRRQLQPIDLPRIPFAFAGDQFQTLNPTGFDWDMIRSNFYQTILYQLDKRQNPKLEIQFEELSFNYRSRREIVQLCNVIHLLRGIAFQKKYLQPQHTWFDSTADLPCYFDIESRVFQSGINKAEEIFIILPCQEGEEYEFAQKDNFLARFANQGNDEQTLDRNILSPMRIKGLERKRVILYKFGDACVNNYPQLIEYLTADNSQEPFSREEALPLEYFMNRLYVAASRAQIRLFIADTEEGLQGFWQKIFENTDFDKWIETYKDIWKPIPGEGKIEYPWKTQSDIPLLTKIRPGKADDWEGDSDDPLEIAHELEDMGKTRKDTFLLQRAAYNYRIAGAEDDALRCDALSLEIKEQFEEAGDKWLELEEKDRAQELFWKARAFNKIAENGTIPLYITAAGFMANKQNYSFNHAKDLLKQINDAIEKNQVKLDVVWGEVLDELYQFILGNSKEDDLKPFEWQNLAQDAERHFKLKILQKEDYVNQLKVRGTTYPEKLDLLQKTGANPKQIVEVYQKNKEETLSESQVQIVMKALRSLKMREDFVSLVEKYKSARNYAHALAYDIQSGKTDSIMDWAQRLLEIWVNHGEWDAALDWVKGKRLNQYLDERDAKLVREYDGWKKYAFDIVFIRLLSVSDTLVNSDTSEKNQISNYLSETLLKHPENFSEHLTIQQAGGAMERAGKVMDCLHFYEMVYKLDSWPANEEDKQFARARWLVCKFRQIDLAKNDIDKRKIQKEINDRAREWHIDPYGLPEFPEVDLDAQPKPLEPKPPKRVLAPEGNTIEKPIKLPTDNLPLGKQDKTNIAQHINQNPVMPKPINIQKPVEKAKEKPETVKLSIIKYQVKVDETRLTILLDRNRGKMTIQSADEMEMATLIASDMVIQGSDADFSTQIETIKKYAKWAEYYIAPWNLTCVLRKAHNNRRIVYADLHIGRNDAKFEILSLCLQK